jgi:hypothetical protein
MRDVAYYRAQAQFWAQMAELAQRPDYRERWLLLSQRWRELAERAQRSAA